MTLKCTGPWRIPDLHIRVFPPGSCGDKMSMCLNPSTTKFPSLSKTLEICNNTLL